MMREAITWAKKTVRLQPGVFLLGVVLLSGAGIRFAAAEETEKAAKAADLGLMNLQLSPAYVAYLDTSDALAKDDIEAAREGFKRLLEALDQVDASVLDETGRARWTATSDAILGAARRSLDSGDRAGFSVHFGDVSDGMLSLVEAFGHALETPLYGAFCPMAFNNKGARWLQAGPEIANPYFGSKMLRCGSIAQLGAEVQQVALAAPGGTGIPPIPKTDVPPTSNLLPNHHHVTFGPTTEPHTDHNPHHRGVLNMTGNLHFETVLEDTGRVQIYFTDEFRRPLPPSIVSDLEVILHPEEPGEEEIETSPDPSGEFLEGQGKPLTADAAALLVAYKYNGAGHATLVEVAHPLSAEREAKQQREAEIVSRLKDEQIPGAINMGLSGKTLPGSYAATYLEKQLGKQLSQGTYQQSGAAHFGNEPHVDIPLMASNEGETVTPGLRAPQGTPARTYDISAIEAEITLNQYHDFYPGYMFVLTENVGKVRDEEARNEAARFEDKGANDPGAVTHGLSGDLIQPLAIRVNPGERLVVNLKNDIPDRKVSFHVHGSSFVVQATGQPATAANADSYVDSGKTKTFEWYVPTDQQEGAHQFHSQIRDQASQGLFGALIVEPRGSRYLDPYTGQQLKSGWMATIEDPNGADFREYVIVYHEAGDEEFRPLMKNEDTIPLRDQETDVYRPSTRAINYRSESFTNNLWMQKKLFNFMDESMGYSAYTFGDPSTPIPRSYLGDPAKWRLVHGGSEVIHSHHLHGGAIRWPRQAEVAKTLSQSSPPAFPPLLTAAGNGPLKTPPVQIVTDRVDVQSIGPAETHDLEIECGSGGCQYTAGDFLYHCHIPTHYVAGMWAFWRVYNTLQAGNARTDVMPGLQELPDRKGRMKPAVDSTELVGRTLNWFGKQFRITNGGPEDTPGVYSIEQWVESQLPPPGKPGKKTTEKDQILAYDASVWDWAKEKTAGGNILYLGEPETTAQWPKYKPEKPGDRPKLSFDPDTGKLAWPHMKPHFGKRPPFSPDHNPAPFLEPLHEKSAGVRNSAVPRPGENGPWSLSPEGTGPDRTKEYNVHAIQLPITLAKASGTQKPIVDNQGQIFVLHEEEAAIRANNALKMPLTLRANVGDTVDVILSSELPDQDENLSSSKVNMHIHFVQFDTQASDGVITGMSYEQSVRPFTQLRGDLKGLPKPQNEPLTVAAAAGADRITLRSAAPFHTGILVGIGMDSAGQLDIRRIKAIEGNVLVLDEPVKYAHKIGEIVSTEFVRYRWYADADFGITYWHDHAFGMTSWGHGLFGSLAVEPRGSTYHDPITGKPVRSGNIVDIHTNEAVSAGVRGSFREFVLQLQDQNPRTENRILSGTVFEKQPAGQVRPSRINKLGSMDSWSLPDTAFKFLNGGERTSGSSIGMRVEPLNRRLKVNPDPSKLFSSDVHGDPFTPMVRAYLGDPIVVRALDHGGVESHTMHFNGHYFPLERFATDAKPKSTVHLNIAERYDLVIPGAGGPQRMAGDYLYHSGRMSHFGEGMWGLLRVLDERVTDLQPLPGREEVPKSAEKLYPDDAPVKTFNVTAIDFALDLNPQAPAVIKTGGTNRDIIAQNPQGKIYVLNEELDDVLSGKKRPQPLTLRANTGDVIQINLTNKLKNGRVSIHADMLAYDPKDSLGINAGRNKGEQTVAPGQSRTYTFYAHPEYGETAALITDWGDVTTHPRDGLYGAIIIGPSGSKYHDPATRDDISLKNAWRADVVVDTSIEENRNRPNYRDVALFFQDEDNLVGTGFMPYIRGSAGLSAVNYRIEPLGWREGHYKTDPDQPYSVSGANDPATPIIEAVAGDNVRLHVFGASSEQVAVFSVEGHQWPLEPKMKGAEMLEADQVGGQETMELNLVAGGPRGIPGDYTYQSHRLAFAEAGQWGILRVMPAGRASIASLDSYTTPAAEAAAR